MSFYIYKHTLPNGKVYIGFTSQKPEERWSGGRGYRTQILFFRAIQKYGWDRITHEILAEVDSIDKARELEREFISQYKSNDKRFGYNITAGGEGTLGLHQSQSAKNKIAKKIKEIQNTPEAKGKVACAAKERWKNDSYRDMMSSLHSQRQKEYYANHPHKGSVLDRTGYHHSEEAKAMMSEIKKKAV